MRQKRRAFSIEHLPVLALHKIWIKGGETWMKRKTIRRGDIYYAQLDPIIGSEQGGIRPVMIVSNNKGNRFGPTVIVAPITSRRHAKKFPTHMEIKHFAGLRRDSVVLFEQIRAIDKVRLKRYIGTIDIRMALSMERKLLISIGCR